MKFRRRKSNHCAFLPAVLREVRSTAQTFGAVSVDIGNVEVWKCGGTRLFTTTNPRPQPDRSPDINATPNRGGRDGMYRRFKHTAKRGSYGHTARLHDVCVDSVPCHQKNWGLSCIFNGGLTRRSSRFLAAPMSPALTSLSRYTFHRSSRFG